MKAIRLGVCNNPPTKAGHFEMTGGSMAGCLQSPPTSSSASQHLMGQMLAIHTAAAKACILPMATANLLEGE